MQPLVGNMFPILGKLVFKQLLYGKKTYVLKVGFCCVCVSRVGRSSIRCTKMSELGSFLLLRCGSVYFCAKMSLSIVHFSVITAQ